MCWAHQRRPQVPISGGGSAFAWGSSTVIALLVVGGVMLVAFLCSQWKLSRLPILPRESAAVSDSESLFMADVYQNTS